MTITRIYCPSIATQWLQILPDYANLSDDSDFFRGIFQIAPEEIKISSGEKKNSSEISTDTSEESNTKSEELAISSGGNQKYPLGYLKIHRERLR